MKRHEHWVELEKQKVILVRQLKQVYEQYRLLVDAVVAGQVTDWQEVMTLLLELIDFADHYALAWELRAELVLYIRKLFPKQVENSNALTRVLLCDSTARNKGERTAGESPDREGETSNES